jgi:hypothetical protein
MRRRLRSLCPQVEENASIINKLFIQVVTKTTTSTDLARIYDQVHVLWFMDILFKKKGKKVDLYGKKKRYFNKNNVLNCIYCKSTIFYISHHLPTI